MLRYGIAVPIIFVGEFALFWWLSGLMLPEQAFLCARAVSLVVYFLAMRRNVFRSSGRIWRQLALFAGLVAINATVGVAAVSFAAATFEAPIAGYLLAQGIMLAFNFFAQRHVVFAANGKE
jgi:hypothetical protein